MILNFEVSFHIKERRLSSQRTFLNATRGYHARTNYLRSCGLADRVILQEVRVAVDFLPDL